MSYMMKNFFSYSVLLLFSFFFFQSCEPSDDSPNEETETLDINPLENLEVIPFQIVQISITDPPGAIDDYSLFLGSEELPVSSVSNEGIEFVVPLDSQPGLENIRLQYKNDSYEVGTVEIIDYRGRFPADLVYFETDDEEYPIIFIDTANTVITPKIVEGEVDEIYVHLADGTITHLELNDIGLPTHVYNENINLIFEGYDLENSTVNIAYYLDDDIESVQFIYGINIETEVLQVFRERNNFQKNPNRDEVFRTLGASLSIVGCAASVLTLPTGLGILGAGLTCGSAAYEVWKYFDPEVENEFASIMVSNFGIKMSLISCLQIAAKPTSLHLFNAINDCASLALEGAKGLSSVYDFYMAQTEREIQQLRNILGTGFGDIKITSTWDTEADIDLWVTDPFSEKIWYENETSSSGGVLDVDNTEGFGPENVYWPTNEAPFGTYIVQIHYFGPEDGPVTNCRVVIDNFGVQTTYNQALTPDGLVTIAIFEAGVRSPNFQQNTISKVSSSELPPKE